MRRDSVQVEQVAMSDDLVKRLKARAVDFRAMHANNTADALVEAAARITELQDEIADLRISVVAFSAPAAARWALAAGFPPGHLHPTHYDILAKAGARMDDFVRHEVKP